VKIYERLDVDEEIPVQFCAVYVTRWRPEWGEPTELFREADEKQQALFDAAPEMLDVLKFWLGAVQNSLALRLALTGLPENAGPALVEMLDQVIAKAEPEEGDK
jgi:hypothetical protein